MNEEEEKKEGRKEEGGVGRQQGEAGRARLQIF